MLQLKVSHHCVRNPDHIFWSLLPLRPPGHMPRATYGVNGPYLLLPDPSCKLASNCHWHLLDDMGLSQFCFSNTMCISLLHNVTWSRAQCALRRLRKMTKHKSTGFEHQSYEGTLWMKNQGWGQWCRQFSYQQWSNCESSVAGAGVDDRCLPFSTLSWPAGGGDNDDGWSVITERWHTWFEMREWGCQPWWISERILVDLSDPILICAAATTHW